MKKLYLLLFLLFTVGFAFGQNMNCPASFTVYTSTDGGADCLATVTTTPDTSGLGFPDGTTYSWVTDVGGYSGATLTINEQWTAGVYTVTWTPSSGTGCSSTVITVEDDNDPFVSGPSSASGTTDGPTVCSHKFPTGDLALSGQSDNCGVDSIFYDITGVTTASAGNAVSVTVVDASDVTFNTGVSTVVYTVKDVNGNTSTHSFDVTVTDDDEPVNGEICGDYLDVYLDPTGSVWLDTVHTQTVLDSVEDNCTADGDLIVEFGTAAVIFGCADISAPGTSHQVLLTVTDTANNDAQCYVNIRVYDTLNPVMSCMADTVYLGTDGTASITTANIDGGTDDNCTVDTMWLSRYSFGCADTGVFAVTLYAEDTSENLDSCSADVTVLDTIAPQIFCLDDTIYLDRDGNASITFDNVIDSIWENTCLTNADTTLSASAFGCMDLNYDTVVTVTIYDHAMLSGSCTSTITVLDTVTPDIFCMDDTVYLDAGGKAFETWMGVLDSAWDNCSLVDTMLAGAVNDTVWFSCTQINMDSTIVVTVEDHVGLTQSCDAKVTIMDTITPLVYCSKDTVYLDASGEAIVTWMNVLDSVVENCTTTDTSLNGADTLFLSCGMLDTVVTISVADNNQLTGPNVGTCQTTVTVLDTITPKVYCSVDTVYLDASGEAIITWENVLDSVIDNCSLVDTTLNGVDTLYMGCTMVGDTTVFIEVTDQGMPQNTGTCTTTVTVLDTIHPTMVCINPALALTVNLDATSGLAVIDSNALDVGTYDNCTIDSMWMSENTFDCNYVLLTDETVTMYARDIHGNISSCTRGITVNDVTPPEAFCTDTTIYLDSDGNATIDYTYLDNGSGDNSDPTCPISYEINKTSFDCGDVDVAHGGVGPIPVLLTVTDVAELTDTATCYVTVVDDIDPTIVCRDSVVQLDADGDVSVDAGMFTASTDDNCTGEVSSIAETAFDCTNVGDSVIVVTVTDKSGNTATCNATVTIEDNVAPDAQCQDISVSLSSTIDAGAVSITAGDIDDGSDDACGIDTMYLDMYDFDCSNINTAFGGNGPVSVELTVEDVNGNVNTCTASVTVVDDTDPTAVCIADTTIALDSSGYAGGTALHYGYYSGDNCGIAHYWISDVDGSSKPAYTSAFGFDCDELGKHVITVSVDDATGNAASCQVTVTVIDTIAPVIVCTPTTVVLEDNGEYVLTAPERAKLVELSWDNCLNPIPFENYSFDNFSFECVNVYTTPAVVEVTATDTNGNSSTDYCPVTVLDETAPIADCVDTLVVVLDATGNKVVFQGQVNDAGDVESIPTWARTYNELEGGSYDACGIAQMMISQNTFSCADIGWTTDTLTVIDPSGNLAKCVSVVKVVDNIAPVFDEVGDIEVAVDVTTCTASVSSYPIVSATDACGVTYTQIAGLGAAGAFPVGPTVETWVATDPGGNTDTVSFTVTVTTTNAAPEIDEIADKTAQEDDAILIVPMEGIGVGTDCVAQEIDTIIATSDNASLIASVDVVYTTGESTGSIELTFVPDASGTATITVTVVDDGGIENGGVNTTVETFTVTVAAVNDAPFVVKTDGQDPLDDQQVRAGKTLDIDISSVLGVVFDDIDDTSLSLEVTLGDGTALPSWGVYASDVLTITPFRVDTGSYTIMVTATDAGGLTATTTFVLDILDWATGVTTIENLVDVKMYPNPARQMVTMDISGNIGSRVELVVMNITGKEVLRQEFQTTGQIQFDMGKQVSGMYFVKLKVDGNEVVKKLILDRE